MTQSNQTIPQDAACMINTKRWSIKGRTAGDMPAARPLRMESTKYHVCRLPLRSG